MADPVRENLPSDPNRDLGFGSVVGGANELRLLNRDGSFNPRREGLSWIKGLHAYHFFLTISWPRFLLLVTGGYFVANVLFALAYLACGPAAIGGNAPDSFGGAFGRAFFFSVETLGTIGYGNVQPVGVAANSLVAVESLVGLMMLALGTGILFARFSRPIANLLFSDCAVVAPYLGITGFMFRLANARANQIIELEAKVLYSRIEGTSRKYDLLELERTKVMFFPLSWTVVHPIDEESPLWELTHQDLVQRDAEFMVLLSGVDETFSQIVHARSSYKPEEIKFGERFMNIYNPVTPEGRVSIDVRKLGMTEPAPEQDFLTTRSWYHTGHFTAETASRPRVES
jgi:inward rectifier potassium channel